MYRQNVSSEPRKELMTTPHCSSLTPHPAEHEMLRLGARLAQGQGRQKLRPKTSEMRTVNEQTLTGHRSPVTGVSFF
jgi:hypothetical protein